MTPRNSKFEEVHQDFGNEKGGAAGIRNFEGPQTRETRRPAGSSKNADAEIYSPRSDDQSELEEILINFFSSSWL